MGREEVEEGVEGSRDNGGMNGGRVEEGNEERGRQGKEGGRREREGGRKGRGEEREACAGV